jgi:WD40 repeat protein
MLQLFPSRLFALIATLGLGSAASAQPPPRQAGEASLPPGAVLRLGDQPVWQPRVAGSAATLIDPDGKTGIIGAGRAILFWDLTTGRIAERWKVPGEVSRVARSPDGKLWAVASSSGNIRLWSTATRELLHAWHATDEHDGAVVALAFSPDSKRLASGAGNVYGHGAADPFLRVWDVTDPRDVKEQRAIPMDANGVLALAFSPDGKTLAASEFSGGGQQYLQDKAKKKELDPPRVTLFDPVTGKRQRRLTGLSGYASELAFSEGGALLAAPTSNGPVVVWHVATGRVLHRLEGSGGCVSFAPQGTRLATAGTTPGVWNARTGERLCRLDEPRKKVERWDRRGQADTVLFVAFSPDGRTVTTIDGKGLVQHRDAATGKNLNVPRGHVGAITEVAFSPDGNLIASGGADQTLRVWGTGSGLQLRKVALGELASGRGSQTLGLTFTPDGRSLLAAQGDGVVRTWEVATGKVTHQLKTAYFFRALAVDAANLRVAVMGQHPTTRNEEARLWDLKAAEESHRLLPDGRISDRAYFSSVAFSPDGKFVVTSAVNRSFGTEKQPEEPTVQLWDVQTGKQIKTFLPGVWNSAPWRLLLGPNCQVFAQILNRVEQWDANTGRKVRQIVIHNRDDYSPDERDVGMTFVLSRDGKWLAAGQGKRVVVHEVATGKRVREFAGHQRAVTALAFSGDSQRLVSGSNDGTLVVWSLQADPSRE